MLAQPQFVEAEFLGVKRLLFVFCQRFEERTPRRVNRHHEESETHLFVPPPHRSSLGQQLHISRSRCCLHCTSAFERREKFNSRTAAKWPSPKAVRFAHP